MTASSSVASYTGIASSSASANSGAGPAGDLQGRAVTALSSAADALPVTSAASSALNAAQGSADSDAGAAHVGAKRAREEGGGAAAPAAPNFAGQLRFGRVGAPSPVALAGEEENNASPRGLREPPRLRPRVELEHPPLHAGALGPRGHARVIRLDWDDANPAAALHVFAGLNAAQQQDRRIGAGAAGAGMPVDALDADGQSDEDSVSSQGTLDGEEEREVPKTPPARAVGGDSFTTPADRVGTVHVKRDYGHFSPADDLEKSF